VGQVGKEALDVAMNQSHNGYAQWRRPGLGKKRTRNGQYKSHQ
jgi:hypothetical protein